MASVKELVDWTSMSNNEKIKNEREHELLMQQRQHHLRQEAYATSRFDITIVTLSSAGIVFSFNSRAVIDDSLSSLSVVMFAIAICSNVISQVYSVKAHKLDVKYTANEIRENAGHSPQGEVPEPVFENSIINICNWISSSLFIVSLGIIGFAFLRSC